MKLLRCPKGYIGTRAGNRAIRIDRGFDEERGYALVRDEDAAELLNLDGYEQVPFEQYPRDLEKLFFQVRKEHGLPQSDLLSPGETNSNTSEIETSTDVCELSDSSTSSLEITADLSPPKCVFCRLHRYLANKFRRKDK